MPTRRALLRALALTGATGSTALLGACRRGAKTTTEPEDTVLRVRVWNEAAAAAYRESLETFTSTHGYTVEVETMAWEEYWSNLPLEVADGSAPDLLWMNTANIDQLKANGEILDLSETLGAEASALMPIALEQYRDEDGLWGIPQTWERTILVANRALVDAAKIDPAKLSFDPAKPTDPLREAGRVLTVDAKGLHPGDPGFDPATRTVFGFSAHPDRSALLGPFIAANGGSWQNPDHSFAFASAQGTAAVGYLASLARERAIAPDPVQMVGDPSLCRQRFTDGSLALLQTGTYELNSLVDGIAGSFTWSLHPPVPGPKGSWPLVHAIALVQVASKDEERAAAATELLTHLISADSMRPLAANRLGIPARTDLVADWQKAWKGQGVDVSSLTAAPEQWAKPERGVRSAEGTGAAMPLIASIFTGEKKAADAMPAAQKAANEAVG